MKLHNSTMVLESPKCLAACWFTNDLPVRYYYGPCPPSKIPLKTVKSVWKYSYHRVGLHTNSGICRSRNYFHIIAKILLSLCINPPQSSVCIYKELLMMGSLSLIKEQPISIQLFSKYKITHTISPGKTHRNAF